MRTISRTLAAMSIAGLAAGGVFAGTAGAAPSPNLMLSDSTVAPGDTVGITANCAGDGLNFVGSTAFAPTGADGPYTGNGGVAKFYTTHEGASLGQAKIAKNTEPGKYFVSQRCGGGNAGSKIITVRAS